MTSIALSQALAPFNLDDATEFDLGPFKVTLKRFTMSNPSIRAQVERLQKANRRKFGKQAHNLKDDVHLFCRICLVSWTLTDDKGAPVPIEKAPDVLLGTGQKDEAIIKAGRELYFNLLKMSRDDDLFEADGVTTDEAEAKN